MQIHVYSDGGIDVSRDGRYLVTGALAYVSQSVPFNASVNTQGISAIEQLERLPHFWTNSSISGTEASGIEDNCSSLPLTPRSAALFHHGANIPRTFPSVSASSSSSSSSSIRRSNSPSITVPIHRSSVDLFSPSKPIFFDPISDRADAIVGQ